MLKGLGFVLLTILRYIAFTALFTLRKPIRLFMGLFCSPLMFLMIIVIAICMPENKAISLVVTITMYVISLVFLHLYDFLLTRLSPEPLVLD
jgi:hypothetical protein